MSKAATVDNGPLYEVRRDIDIGPRTLKRGSHITLGELERLAPAKVGPLRRTGIIRRVGETDKDRISQRRDERKEYLHRAVLADDAKLAELRSVKPSEVRQVGGSG